MRVSIMNTAALVSDVLSVVNQNGFNPLQLQFTSVNDNLFKISDPTIAHQGILVEKVDINDLFAGYQVDLSGLVFTGVDATDFTNYNSLLNVDVVRNLPKLDTGAHLAVPETDILGQWFVKFLRFTGITTLSRAEVDLSLSDNQLIIETTRSACYKGSLTVKLLA